LTELDPKPAIAGVDISDPLRMHAFAKLNHGTPVNHLVVVRLSRGHRRWFGDMLIWRTVAVYCEQAIRGAGE
jgi:hypothetical protein